MTSTHLPRILIIGGTGAQGGTIARFLANTNKYQVRILTRSLNSAAAKDLAAIPNIELVSGSNDSDADVDAALKDVDAVYLNTNGFAIGIKNETYTGIRIYELSHRAGVKHFIYAGLDNLGPITNYDDKYAVGHYIGKGRVVAFIEGQAKTPMAWTNILSGPYAEMLFESLVPSYDAEKDIYIFAAPLKDGTMPLIHLEDLARYVLWALENPSESNGLTFGAATAHTTWPEVVSSFTKLTGKQAIYDDIPISQWITSRFGAFSSSKIGVAIAGEKDESLQTWTEDFTKWWELYQAAGESAGGDGQGFIKRDYAFLDRILPERVRSIGEWMEKVGYDGTAQQVLQAPKGNKVH
jgi:nucleoside-diphosphate-sugar epimerase